MSDWTGVSIRVLEKDSIREFLERNSKFFNGSVLDFGCGLQPYKEIVEKTGSTYTPFDRTYFPSSVCPEDVGPVNPLSSTWNVILSNQMLQYLDDPLNLLTFFHRALEDDGYLIMTYPTNWDEVEPADKFRFTKNGMDLLLTRAGFSSIPVHERRASIDFPQFSFPLGYGVVAAK